MQQQAEIIDIVEDHSCPNQTDTYQDAFRQWRRKKNNHYAFRFTKNPKETAFSETAVHESATQAEQAVLHRFGVLVGMALLCYLVIENVLDKLLVLILQRREMNIELVFWGESILYGDEQLVFWIAAIVQVLKFVVPVLILALVLRLPVRVSVPLPVTKPLQLLYGIALTMLLSAGLGMFCVRQSAELDKYRLIAGAVGGEDHRLILYMLFTIFILPLIEVMLFHGCLFQAMRQFGDRFVILTTSILAALLMHDLLDSVRVGLIILTIGYFQVKTGSFVTAAILRIIHEIYMFALYYIESMGSVYSLEWWIIVLFPCLVGIAALICMLPQKKKHPDETENEGIHLSLWDQSSAFFTSMPMVAFTILCMLLLVVSAILD